MLFAKIKQAFIELAARPKPKWISRIIRFCVITFVPKRFAVDGVIYVPNPRDYILTGHLFLGIYENAERAIFSALCGQGMKVLDLGGNIGIFTGIAAKRIGASGKVITFEPEPNNSACLQSMLDANGFKNVQLERKAVADKNSRFSLYLSSDNMGDHRLQPAEEARESIEIEAVALDEYLPDFTPQLIKMDIQGAEGLACQGMRQLLARMPEGAVLMEFWPYALRRADAEPESVLDCFESASFEGWEIDTARQILFPANHVRLLSFKNEPEAANLLFLKGPAFREQVLQRLSAFCQIQRPPSK